MHTKAKKFVDLLQNSSSSDATTIIIILFTSKEKQITALSGETSSTTATECKNIAAVLKITHAFLQLLWRLVLLACLFCVIFRSFRSLLFSTALKRLVGSSFCMNIYQTNRVFCLSMTLSMSSWLRQKGGEKTQTLLFVYSNFKCLFFKMITISCKVLYSFNTRRKHRHYYAHAQKNDCLWAVKIQNFIIA